jgi:hypothetical protein
MGGDPKQKTTPMSPGEHQQLHNDLNSFLRGKTDEFGNHMRPQRGNSGERIRANFPRDQRINAMADFYTKYGSKYPRAANDFFASHPNAISCTK